MSRNSYSRRQFMRSAAAAVAAPLVIPATSLGRGWRVAPSERITLGMIGVGNMGSGHLETLLGHPEVQIVAVCDVDAEKRRAAVERTESHYAAEKVSGTFRGCDGYNEFEKLLARTDLDAVLIAVPDHWHAIISIAAARAGKDIYCEKPLALTVREARAMVDAVRRHARVFQTGSQQRSSPEFRRACEYVRSGRIGRLQSIHVNIGPPSRDKYFEKQPVREGLDWDRWLGPAPWAEYNAERCSGDYSGGWRRVRDYSGGMTTDWGAHHFDIGQWALGMDESGPVEITPPPKRDDWGLTFRYAGGVTMSRHERYEDHPVSGVYFVGTDGRIEVNRGHLKTWPDEIIAEPLGAKEVHLFVSPGHHQNWFDCIRSRRRPICDVEVGCRTITACHLGNIACWTERVIRWDPEKERIVGDESAARWLDRPRRGPWRI
ncbi:MAG: Gfo/Idh/MocA family oxidoreductase [Planctomycetia bacterium]|nr:Gfo/Idh/MocA family oxidoreductase [Planctomycetia bacterium]MCK6466021.1 Gfo/Idh/MocA family oxidoreductase [Phycisphaerae bacterium]NUQ09677.1 Gfo/Idh/MocA family oxidoreductase [Phycisphaerae bacterium]